MSGLTQLRLAALCAFAYALLSVSGLVHHFQRTGSLRSLLHGLMQARLWVVLVIALALLLAMLVLLMPRKARLAANR